MHENGEMDRHKLIGKSGRVREREDKKKQAVSRAMYVILGALVVCDVFLNFSLLTIVQWIVRMLPVIIAIISGSDGGYCNVTVTEVNFKNGQINVINLFEEYIYTTKFPPQKNQGNADTENQGKADTDTSTATTTVTATDKE